MRDRQRVFEQAAGEREELALGGWERLEWLALAVEDRQHQATQRLVGDVGFGQVPQVLEHGIDGEARFLNEVERVETGRRVVAVDEADIGDVQLRSIGRVFIIKSTNLEKGPYLPVLFAGLEPGTIRPGHESGGAAAVAKLARVKRLAVFA